MNHLKSYLLTALFILTAAYMTSCTESNNTQAPTTPGPAEPTIQKIVLEGDGIVLARVAGVPITRYDLEQTIQSTSPFIDTLSEENALG